MVMYDDQHCKIEIVDAMYPGCYFVILDGDDECAVACMSREEAESEAQIMREEFLEDNGQFGVGA